MTLHLVNTNQFEDRALIVQAGVFGEHQFLHGEIINTKGDVIGNVAVEEKWLHVSLPAGTGITLRMAMERFVHTPTYDMPWQDSDKNSIIQGRV